MAELPNWVGPLHWHPDFEIATADCSTLDYQVGEYHIRLEAGDSILINGNIIHGVKQLSGDEADAMPNIVFSATFIASQTSILYEKYVQSLIYCDSLPFIVFRKNDSSHKEVLSLIEDTYKQMDEKNMCYEFVVQRNLNRIFEFIFCNFSSFPKVETTRMEINHQIRLQKMLMYIYEHYSESVTLEDISKAANISRSEAGRCFRKYMNCSPIEALIQYRLQKAHQLLNEKTLSLQEISFACGFHSVYYFSRQFHDRYGYSPSEKRRKWVNNACD